MPSSQDCWLTTASWEMFSIIQSPAARRALSLLYTPLTNAAAQKAVTPIASATIKRTPLRIVALSASSVAAHRQAPTKPVAANATITGYAGCR